MEEIKEHGGIYILTNTEMNEYIMYVFGKEIIIKKRLANNGASIAKVIAKKVCSSLNHLFESLRLNNLSVDEYVNMGNKFIKAYNELTPKVMGDIVNTKVNEGISELKIKADHYMSVMEEYFLKDPEFLKYLYVYTIRHTKFPPPDNKKKEYIRLNERDVTVVHILSIYLKILHLFYYLVSDTEKFDDFVLRFSRLAIPYLEELTNHMTEADKPFMESLFEWADFYTNKNVESNSVLMAKYAAIGYTKDLLNGVGVENLFKSTKGYSIKHQDTEHNIVSDDEEGRNYMLGEDVNDYSFYFKLTVAYFQTVYKNVMSTNICMKNMKGIISTISEGDGGEDGGLSKIAKHEVSLVKLNKEHYQEVDKMREYIMREIDKEIEGTEYEDILIELTYGYENMESRKTKKFNVSLFSKHFIYKYLTERYDAGDVFPYLFRDQQVKIVTICSKALKNRYPILSRALLGTPSIKKNKNIISADEIKIQPAMMVVNKQKVLSIINEICKTSYIVKLGNTIQDIDIKDEFLKFIQKDEVIYDERFI